MATTYGKACVTFSASHSVGPDTGLYAPHIQARKTHDQTPDNRSIGLTYGEILDPLITANAASETGSSFISMSTIATCPYRFQGETCEVNVSPGWMPPSLRRSRLPYYLGGYGRPFDPVETQHLQSRGWVLQERLLSQRTLHFASDQIYWQCKSEFSAEDGTQCDPAASHNIIALLQGQKLPLNK